MISVYSVAGDGRHEDTQGGKRGSCPMCLKQTLHRWIKSF